MEAELVIPKTISDITEDWLLSVVCHVNSIDIEDISKVLSVEITVPSDPGGVLSDICKCFVHLETKKRRVLSHSLFVKVVPVKMKDIVTRHELFQREIVFYRDVLPLLKRLPLNHKVKLRHFSSPKFLCGFTNDEGEGFLVLEDISSKGYSLFDTSTMLFDLARMKSAVQALAEFHALSLAYDLTTEGSKLSDQFDLFSPHSVMWFQDDMIKFLEAISKSATQFLDSIPGEQDTSRRLYSRLSDPLALFKEELERPSPFKCLQHADSWHNNFMFHKARNGLKVAVVDWQVSYFGNGLSDLCYLLYSTSTSLFRRLYIEELLQDYYECLTETMRRLEVNQELFNPTFQEFSDDFYKCLPLCLLFCCNAEDLYQEADDDCPRRLSLASDKEVRDLIDPMKRATVDPRMARALRRKNYLDICREACRRDIL